MACTKNTDRSGNLPGALGKQIVFAINMDHSVLEDTLPLILNSSYL